MIIKLRGIHLNGQSGRQGGFTLIESMIAIAILSLGLSGLTIMALNSVKANQQAKLRFMATDIITSEIEQIKLLGYVNLTQTNLTDSPFNYVGTFAELPEEYKFNGINPGLVSPYDYSVFKGIKHTITVKGETFHYLYTLKLSVQESYLATPTLRRLNIEIFWMYENRLQTYNLVFMVGRK